MILYGKPCVIFLVCLSTYIVVEGLTQGVDVCGFQICDVGVTFCYNHRCRSCSDLDGTSYGCQNDSTWSTCFLHCRDKLKQEYEAEIQMYNRTWSKRLDECEFNNETSNNTMRKVIKNKDTVFYHLVPTVAILGLCISLVIVLFLVLKRCRGKRKDRANDDPENATADTVLLSDSPSKDILTTTVLSDETESKRVNSSESSSQKDADEDSRDSETTFPSYTKQGRDLLRGIPPVQDSSTRQSFTLLNL